MLRMTGTVNRGWKSLTWLQVKEGFKQLVKKLDLTSQAKNTLCPLFSFSFIM